jgi:hypothetical protein
MVVTMPRPIALTSPLELAVEFAQFGASISAFIGVEFGIGEALNFVEFWRRRRPMWQIARVRLSAMAS